MWWMALLDAAQKGAQERQEAEQANRDRMQQNAQQTQAAPVSEPIAEAKEQADKDAVTAKIGEQDDEETRARRRQKFGGAMQSIMGRMQNARANPSSNFGGE